jgi:hypothetical protein
MSVTVGKLASTSEQVITLGAAHMKKSLVGTGAAAGALLAIGVALAPAAAAEPGDYGNLPVDPNVITDSTAYAVTRTTPNPNGQPGIETVYSHRDDSRTITDTILVLPDPATAAAALESLKTPVVTAIPGGATKSAPVGTGGTIVTGASPDGTQSVTVVSFTQGNTATSIEFAGAPGDPVPSELALEYAQRQDTTIKDAGLL